MLLPADFSVSCFDSSLSLDKDSSSTIITFSGPWDFPLAPTCPSSPFAGRLPDVPEVEGWVWDIFLVFLDLGNPRSSRTKTSPSESGSETLRLDRYFSSIPPYRVCEQTITNSFFNTTKWNTRTRRIMKRRQRKSVVCFSHIMQGF